VSASFRHLENFPNEFFWVEKVEVQRSKIRLVRSDERATKQQQRTKYVLDLLEELQGTEVKNKTKQNKNNTSFCQDYVLFVFVHALALWCFPSYIHALS
jgi:hypothetical protein